MKTYSFLIIWALLLISCQSKSGLGSPVVSDYTPSPFTDTNQVTKEKTIIQPPSIETVTTTSILARPMETAVFNETAIHTLISTSTKPASLSPHIGTKYNAPPTIMFHESHEDFDSPEFLRQVLVASSKRNMHIVTYSQLEAQPELLKNGATDLLIITIDDISLQAKIDPSVLEMIKILLEADAVAVLGVVTEGDSPDPETAATLRDLHDRGWEIASHGDTHRNLLEIELESPGHVRFDIRDSKEKIFDAIGVEPNVLILPYGQMVNNARLLYKEGIKWAVGISGGHTIDLTDRVIYVGRQGPAGSGEETLQLILSRYPSTK